MSALLLPSKARCASTFRMLVVPDCCPHFIAPVAIDSIFRIATDDPNCIMTNAPLGRSWTSASKGISSACMGGDTTVTGRARPIDAEDPNVGINAKSSIIEPNPPPNPLEEANSLVNCARDDVEEAVTALRFLWNESGDSFGVVVVSAVE